jgi:hypothetical protein
MLGEITTVLGIITTVIDIWDRIGKRKETTQEAKKVAQLVEEHAASQNVREVVQSLHIEASKHLPSLEAAQLTADIRYRWVLEPLRIHLETNKGWDTLLKPEFPLVMQKVFGTMPAVQTVVGFISGPPTAQEVDRELKRWEDWLSSRSRKGVTGILIYVYDDLSGVSPKHVIEKKGIGLLDLSRMKLELHKTAMQKRMANTVGLPPTPIELDFQDGLEALHDYYLQVSGYFR